MSSSMNTETAVAGCCLVIVFWAIIVLIGGLALQWLAWLFLDKQFSYPESILILLALSLVGGFIFKSGGK